MGKKTSNFRDMSVFRHERDFSPEQDHNWYCYRS